MSKCLIDSDRNSQKRARWRAIACLCVLSLGCGQSPRTGTLTNITASSVIHFGRVTSPNCNGEGVEGAVVYIPAPEGVKDHNDDDVHVQLRNGVFSPDYVVTSVDQPLSIRWSAQEEHVLRVQSAKQEAYSHTTPPSLQKFSEVFSQPEECLFIVCSRHPKETLRVTVIPRAYYTITDENGEFQLAVPSSVTVDDLHVFHVDYGKAVTRATKKTPRGFNTDVILKWPEEPEGD